MVRGSNQAGMISDLRSAWLEAKKYLTILRGTNSHNSYKGVRGIVSNVMSLLFNLKWEPVAWNCWRCPRGDPWIMDDHSVAPHIIAHKIIQTAHHIDLINAQHHFNGMGMADGIDWFVSLSLHRSWKSSANLMTHINALETILC